MLAYLDYLKNPENIWVWVIICIIAGSQVIGAILDTKNKVAPEILTVWKICKRKKKEREALTQLPALLEEFRQVPDTLHSVQTLLNNVDQHYSADNISKRDGWIQGVNTKLDSYDRLVQELSEKLDKNCEDTKQNSEVSLSLLIDNKRDKIIDFASYVIEGKNPVTREQFNRIFKIYEEYEKIIAEKQLTNGEVDIAIRIIRESYESHMKNHTFIEDVRGY